MQYDVYISTLDANDDTLSLVHYETDEMPSEDELKGVLSLVASNAVRAVITVHHKFTGIIVAAWEGLANG